MPGWPKRARCSAAKTMRESGPADPGGIGDLPFAYVREGRPFATAPPDVSSLARHPTA